METLQFDLTFLPEFLLFRGFEESFINDRHYRNLSKTEISPDVIVTDYYNKEEDTLIRIVEGDNQGAILIIEGYCREIRR